MHIDNFTAPFAKFATICIIIVFLSTKKNHFVFNPEGNFLKVELRTDCQYISSSTILFQNIDTSSDQLSIRFDSRRIMRLDERTQIDLLHLSIYIRLWTSEIGY